MIQDIVWIYRDVWSSRFIAKVWAIKREVWQAGMSSKLKLSSGKAPMKKRKTSAIVQKKVFKNPSYLTSQECMKNV